MFVGTLPLISLAFLFNEIYLIYAGTIHLQIVWYLNKWVSHFVKKKCLLQQWNYLFTYKYKQQISKIEERPCIYAGKYKTTINWVINGSEVNYSQIKKKTMRSIWLVYFIVLQDQCNHVVVQQAVVFQLKFIVTWSQYKRQQNWARQLTATLYAIYRLKEVEC